MALEAITSESPLLDDLPAIEADLDRAEAAGVLQPLPDSRERFIAATVPRRELPVLRDRLFRLGYLRSRSGPDRVDAELTRAIEHLQREARLTVDGWVGPQTWAALQELFAFEPPTHLDRWIDERGATSALQRAACLRLIALGFLPGQTRASLQDLSEPLDAWRRVLATLNAPCIGATTALDSLKLIGALFDIDRLSVLVAQEAATVRRILGEGAEDTQTPLRRFLVCLLKIELWLLGDDEVRPDGKVGAIRRYRRRRAPRRGVRYDYSPLYGAIRRFWQDSGVDRGHASEAEILLRCFSTLAAMQHEERDQNEAAQRSQRMPRLIDEIGPRQAQVAQQWHEVGFVSRLWDGVKRVWRLLKRIAVTAARRLVLLVRAAKQAAQEAADLLRRSIGRTIEGLRLLLDREVPGSTDRIAMRHTADFDFEVFVAAAAPPAEVRAFIEQLRTRLAALRAAVRVLRWVIAAVRIAARAAAGPWAWWPLVRALIDLNGRYTETVRTTLLRPLPD